MLSINFFFFFKIQLFMLHDITESSHPTSKLEKNKIIFIVSNNLYQYLTFFDAFHT